MSEASTLWEKLLSFLRSLGSLSEEAAFLQMAIGLASELAESESASILEYDEDWNALRFRSAPWFHQELLKDVRVPIEGSIAGWVFTHREPLIVNNASQDQRLFKGVDRLTGMQTRNLIAVPIIANNEVLGVLEVLNRLQGEYTQEDMVALEILAGVIGLRLSNLRLQQQMKLAREDVMEIERLKNEFIAITSHELRTPLGLILGHATFLRELLQDSEYRAQLDVIIRSATRLKEIVENLSNIEHYRSGASRLRKRPILVARLIEEVIAAFASAIQQKNLHLKLEIKDPQMSLECDAEKITTALRNLVQNAVTFTEPGGHILVRAEAVPGHVKISVIDDGIGIPAKDIPHIFERFYQVESHLTRRHGGLGLGLSIAKAMIEMHGGQIWVESIEGKGSNFTFLLPMHPQT
ncbi:MAG: ATP-binding protein [Anaerolineales bacterium]